MFWNGCLVLMNLARNLFLSSGIKMSLWMSTLGMSNVLQNKVLESLHSSHHVIVQTKALTRNYFWWPNLDSEIEDMIKRCENCQMSRSVPAKTSIIPWIWPKRPWCRIHCDFAGPYLGKKFLIVVISYSKWLILFSMPSWSTSCCLFSNFSFKLFILPYILWFLGFNQKISLKSTHLKCFLSKDQKLTFSF